MRLLDSNILIYAAQPDQVEFRRLILNEPAGISLLTKVEVLGFHRLSGEEERDIRELLSQLVVFAADTVVAERAIVLRKQRKMGLADAIIAATALVHDLPLVTRNVADFRHVEGLELINPFAEP